jgi:FKBP-type peptidyl-prolyl cis-trans isomerase FklB
MKRWLTGMTLAAFAYVGASPAETPPTFKNLREKASYSAGVTVGKKIRSDFGTSDAFDLDAYMKGLKSGLAGESPLTIPEMAEALTSYRTELVKSEGIKFLEKNKKKDGVKTTASGLQYEVLKSGDGKSPTAADTVVVHYTGTLVNGKKFDSSHDRKMPAEFPVGRVIEGWQEALKLMKVGDKWRVFIPQELGYKAAGYPPNIPPFAVLIFEMELLGIK